MLCPLGDGRAVQAFCLVLALVTSQGSAGAQVEPSSDAVDQEARGLFEAGRAAFSDGRFDDALRYFRESFELSGRVELLYNIGTAADRLRESARLLKPSSATSKRSRTHPTAGRSRAESACFERAWNRRPTKATVPRT